ncbi:MAG: GNAT family N-acetyltransferase [Patescibacteria group bacterium]
MEIREFNIQDAAAALAFFRKLVHEDPERVERPQDVARLTIADEKRWIQERTDKEKAGEFFTRVAIEETSIVAEGEVERMKRWIERHVAELRFGVLPGNEVAAEKLVQKLIRVARAHGIEVLIYFHLATQKRGIRIAEKVGFRAIGKAKRYYKRGKTYTDRVYMLLNL